MYFCYCMLSRHLVSVNYVPRGTLKPGHLVPINEKGCLFEKYYSAQEYYDSSSQHIRTLIKQVLSAS